MEFQLKYSQADAEGIIRMSLSNIESLKNAIHKLKELFKYDEDYFVKDAV